jgi:hypothetical protein
MGPQHVMDDLRVGLTSNAAGWAVEGKPDDTHVNSVPADTCPGRPYGVSPAVGDGLRGGSRKPGGCACGRNDGDYTSRVRHDDTSNLHLFYM